MISDNDTIPTHIAEKVWKAAAVLYAENLILHDKNKDL